MEKSDIEVVAKDGHVVGGTYRPVDDPVATALFVHGIFADRREWGYYDQLTARLQSSGVATFAIDYRGHGSSELPREQLMLSGIMLDIDAAWRHLLTEHPGGEVRRVISGNSFGGGVAYLYGSTSGAADHMLLTMPVLSYIDDISRVNPDWRNDLADGFIGYAGARLPALLAPEFHFFDTLIEQAPPTCPYTILHGRADSDVPFSASEDFQRRHPHGRVLGLDGMDHTWAAPGDMNRETEQSRANQRVAVDTSAQLLDEVVGR